MSLWHALVDRWTVVPVGVALTLAAALINRFAPKSRKDLRRTAILYALYLAAFAIDRAFHRLGGAGLWGERLHFVTALIEAYTIVSLGGLVLFDVALPRIGVALVSITSDLAVGVAYIVATLGVIHGAGMDLGSVIATSAIVSGVLALSLQATLGNILGGVALQLDGSIHVGDWIQLDNGKSGKVKAIRWRHTVVETRDWDTIVVPNASLLASNITILGKREGAAYQHRMWVYFNVDFRYAPQQVIAIVNDALCAAPIDRVAAEPKPHCICLDFAKDGRDSFAYYAVRYWLTDLAVDDPTSSVIRSRIYAALKRAEIPLARASQTVFFTPDDETQEERRRIRHHEKRVKALGSIDLFKPLTDAEREILADRLRYAPFTAGETITKQGAVAHWLYVLVSGMVDIQARVAGESIHKTVASLRAPSFFGEAGLMTGEPRTADVIATSDVECYRLDKEAFQKVLEERPEMAREMSTTLASRRVELMAVRDGLDVESRQRRQKSEEERILARIQDFFGLT